MTITSLYEIGDLVYFRKRNRNNNMETCFGKIVNIIFTADNFTWWYIISSPRKDKRLKVTVYELHTRKQTEIAKTRAQLYEIMRLC